MSAAFLAAAAIVLGLTFSTWERASDGSRSALQMARAQEVLTALAHARTATLQIELSTQNYRISGDPTHLRARDAAIADREQRLARLQALTAEQTQLRDTWQQLRAVIDQRLAISRTVEHLRREQGAEAANAYAATAPLAATRARSQALFAQVESEELRLLEARRAEQQQARARMQWLGALAALAVFVLLGASYALIRRQFRQNQASLDALAASEQRRAVTLNAIADAVIATDASLRITQMNPAAEQLTGWREAEAQGLALEQVLQLVQAEGRTPAELPARRALTAQRGVAATSELLLKDRQGLERPTAVDAAPLHDRTGQVCGTVTVFRDDSQARAARQRSQEHRQELEQRVQDRTHQLADRESHLRSLINSVPALIAFVDPAQRYGYVNDRYRECFAPDAADITGRSVREVLGERRYTLAGPLIEKALRGEPQCYDWEPFPGMWQQIQYAPKRQDDGTVCGYYVLGTDITERRQMEAALREGEQLLTRVLAGSDQGYWDWNLTSGHFQVSARFESMLGYAPGELQISSSNWPELVHPEDLPRAQQSLQRHLQGESARHELSIRCRCKDGSWRWVLSRGAIVQRNAQGDALLMSGTHTDIHERMQLEEAARSAEVVFENSYEGIIVADSEGLIRRINPAFTRITGYTQAEVLGRSPKLLSSGRHDAGFYREFWSTLQQRGSWQGEIWNRNKRGEAFLALQSVSAVRDRQGQVQHYISVFTDVTRARQHESELDRIAHYDPLTGLPNRRLLVDRLQLALHRADRQGDSCAVCVLDLDDFKQINEAHGHGAGDQLLRGVAEHIRQVLRTDDTLARVGGDEFIVLLSNIGSAQDGALVLDRVLAAAAQPVTLEDGSCVASSASIGVSLYPADHVDPDTLLRHADAAMLQAKEGGKNRYQLFDPESDRLTQHRLEQLKRLELALEQQEFELFYQPKVDLRDGQVVGAEALIRWRHPQRGLVAPGEFLPQLQGSWLEPTVGDWVIEAALRQLAEWVRAGQPLPVSVNISANHLMRAGFVDRLTQALARHPEVPPSLLELEVLETAAISDLDQAIAVMQRCMPLGVGFSLDDFGTGYSSLTYLRKLPAQTLKIDQSFVRDMLADAGDLSIVQGVIQLAAAFHRQVIAEGVETMAHGAALLRLGCWLAQGYGIARPMPATEWAGWWEHWRAAETWRGL
ncbi:EAL domain-containing protein [Inhella proteolytica]|uniref:EAL domain-containing protein n=1 Tax=Inhella proteolytica TaxID=2795029 RepID=A0A931J6P7_9BURK|nr:EAL domain-containing protein [Inhella proteolytica]MBH9578534.1 EAL domain-containing protein [Inhella proteolytica]